MSAETEATHNLYQAVNDAIKHINGLNHQVETFKRMNYELVQEIAKLKKENACLTASTILGPTGEGAVASAAK